MKTIDEVIHGYECCQAINCAECPYANWNNTDVVRCDPTDKDDDALHYLREYQQEKGSLINARALTEEAYEKHSRWIENCRKAHKNMENMSLMYTKVIADLVDNPPLTWDELTQMIGKPVWDEGKTVKHWTIITGIYYDDLNEGYVLLTYYSERNGAQTIRRKRSTMGKTWNAYRKERE